MCVNKVASGILMVAGTAIGAGIWALPVVTAELGFISSSILLVVAWLIMWMSAKMLQLVNGFMPPKANFLGMVHWSLGLWPTVLCWVVYLLLLYVLVAAYLTGLSDVLSVWSGLSTTSWVAILGMFSLFFLNNIRITNQVSRYLMYGLFATLLVFLVVLSPFLKPYQLKSIQFEGAAKPFTIMLLAFGYQIILPTLRTYLNDDRKLSKVIMWGSIMPLVVYLLWNAVLFMTLPKEGMYRLSLLAGMGNPTTVIPNVLQYVTHNQHIVMMAQFFSFFTIATSLIGVSQGLVDFLYEGLGYIHERLEHVRSLASICAFVPPMVFAIGYPQGFIMALDYGGQLVAILLLGFPVVMFWNLLRRGQLHAAQCRALLLGSLFVMVSAVLLFVGDYF